MADELINAGLNKDSEPHIKFAVLATDIVAFLVIKGKLSVLVGKVSPTSQYEGMEALIGGLILPEETAEKSAERHLFNKANITSIYKEQLYTFSSIDRDKRGRVVSVAYMALAGRDPREISDISINTRWCPIDTIPRLAYDHNEIISVALERIRRKITYTNIAQHLLSEEFTLSDLQKVYQIVLDKSLDKRNFRKKILMAGMLVDTEKTKKEGVMRPAALYRFSSKESQIFEIL